jgi:hypothetical protein
VGNLKKNANTKRGGSARKSNTQRKDLKKEDTNGKHLRKSENAGR